MHNIYCDEETLFVKVCHKPPCGLAGYMILLASKIQVCGPTWLLCYLMGLKNVN